MANHTLFKSSVICSLLHCISMAMYPPSLLYGTFITLALSTSVLNHGLTSNVWKWSDRIIMVAGSGVTIYMASTPTIKHLIVVLGLLYGAAKRYNNVCFHIGAHIVLTCINMQILYTLYHNTHTLPL
jgi:hypothetical protein